MAALPLAIIVAIVIYVLAVMLMPKSMVQQSNTYVDAALAKMSGLQADREGIASTPTQKTTLMNNPFARAYFMLPGAKQTIPALTKAKLTNSMTGFVIATVVIFVGLVYLFAKFKALGFLLALLLTFFLMSTFVKMRIKKQRRAMLNMFPDALEMIVRSVKSGYPLNSAIAMVADNIAPPLNEEFRRIVDETNYGWTLPEALNRFADRLDEPDVRFFVVVLAVQQESGGNLAEVLGNLASVIRKRKQMRLKIHALSSEGRTTAWILGILPLFIMAVLYFMAPGHLTPLFTTSAGYTVLGSVACMVAFGVFMIKQIINIDI